MSNITDFVHGFSEIFRDSRKSVNIRKMLKLVDGVD